MELTSFQKFNWSVVVAIVLTGISYAVGLYFGWVDTLNWIEVTAVFTSYSCTYLCVVQSRWNYPIGAVSIALYAWMFWTSGLLASMALQFYLFPVMLYGWFRWRKDEITLPVTSVFNDAWYWILAYVMVIVAAYGGIYNINLFFGGEQVVLDTMIFVASILAQFLLDNKKIENWAIWFVVNVVSIYVYFNAGLYFIAMQYVFFLMNTIYGFYMWYRSIPKPQYYRIEV